MHGTVLYARTLCLRRDDGHGGPPGFFFSVGGPSCGSHAARYPYTSAGGDDRNLRLARRPRSRTTAAAVCNTPEYPPLFVRSAAGVGGQPALYLPKKTTRQFNNVVGVLGHVTVVFFVVVVVVVVRRAQTLDGSIRVRKTAGSFSIISRSPSLR